MDCSFINIVRGDNSMVPGGSAPLPPLAERVLVGPREAETCGPCRSSWQTFHHHRPGVHATFAQTSNAFRRVPRSYIVACHLGSALLCRGQLGAMTMFGRGHDFKGRKVSPLQITILIFLRERRDMDTSP
jgi:hypothetical protein